MLSAKISRGNRTRFTIGRSHRWIPNHPPPPCHPAGTMAVQRLDSELALANIARVSSTALVAARLSSGATRWFNSDNDNRLYYRSAPYEWQFCIRHPRRQRNYVFKYQLFNISNSDLPDDLRRTVISRSGQLIFAFGSTRDEWRDLPATVPTTFAEYVTTLPKDTQWALRDINLTDDGLTIAQAIRDGTAIGISDGSFKDGFGTASWVLEGPSPRHRI
jgi:hypothetical protein